LFAKADAIADEMLRVLIESYKENSRFELTSRVNQPDEEEFKNKFPWTLDKLPLPKEPAIIKRPEVKKRVKSERELADEKFKAEHLKKQQTVDERHTEIAKYLDFLCNRVDMRQLLEQLNTPIAKDPLKVLKQIQAYDDDSEQSEADPKHSPQQILPYGFFCKVDREYVIMQRMQSKNLT
jgi:hypothetical protein